MLIHEAHAGRNRPSGLPVDHPADDRLSRRPCLRAEGDRGIITGTVKDPSGAAMPRAVVTAIHLVTNTSYKTSTTASGDFTVPALHVGDYQVRVENTGFKTQVENNVAVAAGAT